MKRSTTGFVRCEGPYTYSDLINNIIYKLIIVICIYISSKYVHETIREMWKSSNEICGNVIGNLAKKKNDIKSSIFTLLTNHWTYQ